ncbi:MULTISPECIES: hypothetical protein [unclassified Paraburkholderia]|uniref:hypothetical protein n=1 Tax=unclassified Paraburkholderia TaxID=2615204 RepID=UPI00161E33E4|nr:MULTISPECIES: hypothetical protein [unclassified Paraburkholderia]MBB5446470.1 hypothetical protein [Paraburkholderia sp. WSM4177]MBB5486948.1 hypothetical protein [Paraburkholderia sp. WSM4180]
MATIFEKIKASVGNLEFAWKMFTWIIILGGGTTAGVLAKGSSYVHALGLLFVFASAILCALAIALTFYFARGAQLANAQTVLATAMAAKSDRINPLATDFADSVIEMRSLYLPGQQLHRNKHFRRCKFVGPGSVALLGGTFEHNNFNHAGHILPLPENIEITGITVFQNCTVENCEFFQVTFLVPRNAIEIFRAIPGARIAQ